LLAACLPWARDAHDCRAHRLLSAHTKGTKDGDQVPGGATIIQGAARRSFVGIELWSTIFKSKGMGRERRARGFHSGGSGHEKRRGRGPPRAAMAAAIGAHGELGSGRESEGRQLGLVEEGIEVLTSRRIGLRWAGEGDRWCNPSSVQEQRR